MSYSSSKFESSLERFNIRFMWSSIRMYTYTNSDRTLSVLRIYCPGLRPQLLFILLQGAYLSQVKIYYEITCLKQITLRESWKTIIKTKAREWFPKPLFPWAFEWVLLFDLTRLYVHYNSCSWLENYSTIIIPDLSKTKSLVNVSLHLQLISIIVGVHSYFVLRYF